MLKTVASWRTELQSMPLQSICTTRGALTYREAGVGEPMVFLHGISSGAGSWVHQLAYFRTSARCIAWDAPGYGGSSAEKMLNPSAAEYGQTLEQFLDALKIEKAFIVAHSLGALMATAFAARQPERLNGMVLLDPAIGYGASPREEADARSKARLNQLHELGVEKLAETRAVALVSATASRDAIELIQWNMRQLSPFGYAQAAKMLAAADLLQDAKLFPGQVLVACGTEDTITPEEKCRQVASAFVQGKYVGLPGLGHASYIEDPTAVNRIITEFQIGLKND